MYAALKKGGCKMYRTMHKGYKLSCVPPEIVHLTQALRGGDLYIHLWTSPFGHLHNTATDVLCGKLGGRNAEITTYR